ncbi:MAG: LysM peptidoglycan-binding domain-containing protein [Dysgonamonadaceae bacterium]|jgi:LysM repeat protein|nr:LysM peptidoglycan-binding domain-containing protein [Dysgonamonadaceae bacterium]
MLKRFVLLLFISCSAVFYAKSDNDFFLHTVERGQTVYSISQMYHVTMDDIYSLNPDSRTVVREGQKLKIPQESGSYVFHTIQPQETLYGVSKKYDMKGEDILSVNPGLSVQTFQIGKIIRIPVNRVTTPVHGDNEAVENNKTNSLLTQMKPVKAVSPVRIALLLPFSTKDKKDRMVEYYEGFLLALKEIKSKGISVDLQVYDIGSGLAGLSDILKKEEIQNVHLIIGGVSEQIRKISQFAGERDIPYVIPFTSESDEPYYNSRIYQINTPQSYLYSKASLAFAEKYKNDNIFIISDNKNSANKMEFINALKSDLQRRKISFNTISTSDITVDKLKSQLSPVKRNVFVPDNDSRQTNERLIAALKAISEPHPEYLVALFGYTRWQIDAQQALSEDFSKLNTTFFSGFYSNPLSNEVQTFYKTFYKWYSRILENTFPRYSILGYDTGMFFIQALDRYGATFEDRISEFKYNGIQTCFHFERVNNWGGFVNTGLYFVDYQNDFSIHRNVIN